VRPLVAGDIDTQQAFERGSEPFRGFMMKNVRDKDPQLFIDLPGAGSVTRSMKMISAVGKLRVSP
jgi:flagellar biosynthesis protein FliP